MEWITGFLIGCCFCFLIVVIEELIRTHKWNEIMWRWFCSFGVLVNVCSIVWIMMRLLDGK